MMDFLRDAVWQFVGAILAFLAIVVGWIIYRRQKSVRLLSYEILGPVPIVTVHERFSNDIKMTFQGREVKTAYMGFVTIENRGNVPISRQDFDEPLSVSFTQNGELTSCGTVNLIPENLNISVSNHSRNSVTLNPFLLNVGEEFTLSSVVINGDVAIVPNARIIGGNLKPVELTQSFFYRLLTSGKYPYLRVIIIALLISTFSNFLAMLVKKLH